MAKISNVEVFGLERAFKTAKYPKSVDIKKLNSDLTPGIRACLMCPTGQGHDNALKGLAPALFLWRVKSIPAICAAILFRSVKNMFVLQGNMTAICSTQNIICCAAISLMSIVAGRVITNTTTMK